MFVPFPWGFGQCWLFIFYYWVVLFAHFCFYLNEWILLGALSRDLHPYVQWGTNDFFPTAYWQRWWAVSFSLGDLFKSYLVVLDSSLCVLWLSQGKSYSSKMLFIHFTVFALNFQHKLLLVSLDTSIIWLPSCMHIIPTPDSPKGIKDCTKLPCHYSPSWKIAWSDVTTSDIQLYLTLKHHLQEKVALGIFSFKLWQLHLIT